jgi:hypothetical protein
LYYDWAVGPRAEYVGGVEGGNKFHTFFGRENTTTPFCDTHFTCKRPKRRVPECNDKRWWTSYKKFVQATNSNSDRFERKASIERKHSAFMRCLFPNEELVDVIVDQLSVLEVRGGADVADVSSEALGAVKPGLAEHLVE